MRVGLDAPHDVGDVALGIDQERRPLDAHVRLAVELALAPDAVAFGNVVVGIRQQRERQAVLLLELHVRRLVVRADAEDDGPSLAEGVEVVPDPACLCRTARRVVLGIEVDDDGLAPEVREPNCLAGVALELEVGCGLAFLDHRIEPIDSRRVGRAPCARVRGDRGRGGGVGRGGIRLPAGTRARVRRPPARARSDRPDRPGGAGRAAALRRRSEEHTSERQSLTNLVCRLLLEKKKRRLAAILAADIAGYSRLIGVDEEGTLRALRALWRFFFNPTPATQIYTLSLHNALPI